MAEAAVAGDHVVIPFHWRDPQAYTPPSRERVAKLVYDEVEDDDEGFIAEMLSKTLSEVFVEVVILPLMGLAIAAVLALIASGATWAAVKMILATKALIA